MKKETFQEFTLALNRIYEINFKMWKLKYHLNTNDFGNVENNKKKIEEKFDMNK